MKTHKIIGSLPVLKLSQIEGLGRLSKGEAFDNLDETFDFALPQDWLDGFANWCVNNPSKSKGVNYELIVGTTVWSYPDSGGSEPVTCCAEVYYAYRRYEGSLRVAKGLAIAASIP